MSKKINKVSGNLSVRQYFYFKNQRNKESVISSLERTYGHSPKSIEEWEEILSKKNINF